MNKNSYLSAFKIINLQNQLCGSIESIGLRFEYDDGPIGTALSGMVNESVSIILDSLGLHEESFETNCSINGTIYRTTCDVLFADDHNQEYAITVDDFYDFVYYAHADYDAQLLFWDALVEKNEDAKIKINKLNHGVIGVDCSRFNV